MGQKLRAHRYIFLHHPRSIKYGSRLIRFLFWLWQPHVERTLTALDRSYGNKNSTVFTARSSLMLAMGVFLCAHVRTVKRSDFTRCNVSGLLVIVLQFSSVCIECNKDWKWHVLSGSVQNNVQEFIEFERWIWDGEETGSQNPGSERAVPRGIKLRYYWTQWSLP